MQKSNVVFSLAESYDGRMLGHHGHPALSQATPCIDCLSEAGTRFGNTHFIFTGDHGETIMEHREWYKMSFHEGSDRVPLIFTGPDIVKGQCRQNLVSLLDICPTLMEIPGLHRPSPPTIRYKLQ